jgi:hypothetical protein
MYPYQPHENVCIHYLVIKCVHTGITGEEFRICWIRLVMLRRR